MTEPGLFDTLEKFPGIGRLKAKSLAKLGLNRILDVLFFFPRDYEDHSEIKNISEMNDGDSASAIGEVVDFELAEMRGGRSAFYLLIKQDNKFVRGVWFNQPFRAKNIDRGKKVMLSGTVKVNGLRLEMTHPKMDVLEDDAAPATGTLVPVYRLTEGISSRNCGDRSRRLWKLVLHKWMISFPNGTAKKRDYWKSGQHFWQFTAPKNLKTLNLLETDSFIRNC